RPRAGPGLHDRPALRVGEHSGSVERGCSVEERQRSQGEGGLEHDPLRYRGTPRKPGTRLWTGDAPAGRAVGSVGAPGPAVVAVECYGAEISGARSSD